MRDSLTVLLLLGYMCAHLTCFLIEHSFQNAMQNRCLCFLEGEKREVDNLSIPRLFSSLEGARKTKDTCTVGKFQKGDGSKLYTVEWGSLVCLRLCSEVFRSRRRSFGLTPALSLPSPYLLFFFFLSFCLF